MTKLLEKAFTQASRLPSATQNIIAQRLLEDIQAEGNWDDTFAETQSELSRMADEDVADFQNV